MISRRSFLMHLLAAPVLVPLLGMDRADARTTTAKRPRRSRRMQVRRNGPVRRIYARGYEPGLGRPYAPRIYVWAPHDRLEEGWPFGHLDPRWPISSGDPFFDPRWN